MLTLFCYALNTVRTWMKVPKQIRVVFAQQLPHYTYQCQMQLCDALDVLILKLLAAVAGMFNYSDVSMVAQATRHKIKRKEKEISFPPTPTWRQYSVPCCGEQWGPSTLQRAVAEFLCLQ